MPEGDSIRRAAERIGALVGQVVHVETPHPRSAALGLAERLDGLMLEGVEAVGKNLLLTFEGGIVLRSHLRMRGRWRVEPAGSSHRGTPWLVLRGSELEAVLWNGPVLTIGRGHVDSLGPDIMEEPPRVDAMLDRLRSTDQSRELGEALVDQRLVAGIGNRWKAEGLWLARLSPWRRLDSFSDAELALVLEETSRAMRTGRGPIAVYRRAGLTCRCCSDVVRARAQGDDARMTYWCPGCQAGTGPSGA
jgi:endonuclease-8